MSKKLLMNNYSENGLMPVMDGLICWLDGRDGENDDKIWKDRSGNDNDGILYNFDKSQFCNGYLISKNYANYVKIFENIEIQDKTFIINVKLLYNNINTFLMGYWGWHLGADSFGIINGYPTVSQSSVICSQKQSGAHDGHLSTFVTPSQYTNIAVTISDNKVKTFINSILTTTSVDKRKLLIKTFYLLRKDDTLERYCSAKIGSFMTYNRALTEEEIQQNYLYEQSIKRGE